ncbi:uncharacterized protein LOC129903618 [Solanum dulcamara]|uniref:uncharacterized protein LOC129903618 n=1 Tax=Solanum dulcamara TaxID=45834 RepID=UPI0024865983|nr:uncharacterized protein LOC129903618 [Solanum dulcamara]
MAARTVRDVVVPLTANVTSSIQKSPAGGRSRILNKVKLPTKQKDSKSFTVQVTIGSCVNARGLCDLGARINLIPTSMFKKLVFGNLKPTTILLQLEDHSIVKPYGIIEDVLVQVGSLIFPMDFVILEFKPYPEVSFILG